jgi:hypothetical protein
MSTTDITEIAICATGDTWEVIATRDGFADSDEPIWCENKAEALKEGRALFNATPTAKRLIAESKRDFCFHTIRER